MKNKNNYEFIYVVRLKCGCAVKVFFDHCDDDTTNKVRKFLAKKFIVEHVSSINKRLIKVGCSHKYKQLSFDDLELSS